MIAVNASTSPHSNVSFTPFGSDALTFAGEGSGRFLSAFSGGVPLDRPSRASSA